MTLARVLRYPPAVEPAPVAGNVRFAPGASDARSSTAGTAPGSSIATTAGLAAGTRRCNNAPSDAGAESSSRIPLANTAGSAAAVLILFSFVGIVDFFQKLRNLDWGSWERSLPDGSSLGGDVTPLRGAFHSVFSADPLRIRAGPKLYQTSFIIPATFCGSRSPDLYIYVLAATSA